MAPTGGALDERRLRFGWRRARTALFVLYVVGYVWWFGARGILVDRFAVLLSIALLLVIATVGRPLHRWRRMAGDLALIVSMWLVYDESRGVADRLGFPVQVESIRNLDRWLFLGTDPVVWLQRRFLAEPGTVRWYDVVGSMIYYSHFVIAPLAIAVLWIVSRDQWVRFMRRFATVLFAACALFVVLPTAPPWMAAGGRNSAGLELDALPPLRRPTGNGWRHLGLDAFVNLWDHGRDWSNQVAALPSLHSATALLVVVFCFRWIGDRRIRLALLSYPLLMAVTLAYFAEHYLVDALAGWALVGASFWAWGRIESHDDEITNAEARTGPESAGGSSDPDELPELVGVGRDRRPRRPTERRSW